MENRIFFKSLSLWTNIHISTRSIGLSISLKDNQSDESNLQITNLWSSTMLYVHHSVAKERACYVHILLWLIRKTNSNQIDSIISAELPDPEIDPALFKIVKRHMVHGPEVISIGINLTWLVANIEKDTRKISTSNSVY